MANRVAQPPWAVPLMTAQGVISPAWLTFFASLVAMPGPIVQQALAVAPATFAFQASVPGQLLVIGGTVTGVALTRARVAIASTGVTSGFIPLGQGDQVSVAYTVIPAVYFIPT